MKVKIQCWIANFWKIKSLKLETQNHGWCSPLRFWRNFGQLTHLLWYLTAKKLSALGVILVHIFPHSHIRFWNTDTILDTITFLWPTYIYGDIYGRCSVPYTANQVWNLLPCEKKVSANLDSFAKNYDENVLAPYVKHIYQI